MALKKKRIGELEGSPLVIGDNNLVNDFETLVEMNPDNTIKDIKKRKGDQFHTVINNETINSLIDLLNELMEDGEFGALVLSCQASVSDDELISLFGDEKTLNDKSRRQALIEQLLQAYSIEDDLKILDFSKLLAIGNGEKIDVQILHGDAFRMSMDFLAENNPGLQQMPMGANIILVVFKVDTLSIMLVNTSVLKEEENQDFELTDELGDIGEIYVYPTYSTDGKNVSGQSFGTFTLKTRAEE